MSQKNVSVPVSVPVSPAVEVPVVPVVPVVSVRSSLKDLLKGVLQFRRVTVASCKNTKEGTKAHFVPKADVLDIPGLDAPLSCSVNSLLLLSAEYAHSKVTGKTEQEIRASEELTFFAAIASLAGSVSIKTAVTAEVSAEKSTARSKVIRVYSDELAGKTAELFVNK